MKKEYFNVFIIATIGRPSLKEAINSCLNQKRETLVVVVFDDEEITRIVDNPNVVYLKTAKHVWGEGARQHGVDWCKDNKIKSTYISYLDDDDIILPSYTDSLEEFLSYDIVVHSMKIFENGRIVPEQGYYNYPHLSENKKIQISTRPLIKNYVGLSFSLKWDKAKNINWYSNGAEKDFNYIDTACKSGLTHIKTGKISYHQLTRGLTGSHTNVKYGRYDSNLNK